MWTLISSLHFFLHKSTFKKKYEKKEPRPTRMGTHIHKNRKQRSASGRVRQESKQKNIYPINIVVNDVSKVTL